MQTRSSWSIPGPFWAPRGLRGQGTPGLLLLSCGREALWVLTSGCLRVVVSGGLLG